MIKLILPSYNNWWSYLIVGTRIKELKTFLKYQFLTLVIKINFAAGLMSKYKREIIKQKKISVNSWFGIMKDFSSIKTMKK